MNSSSPENPNGKKYSPVFIYSAIVVAIVVLLGAFLPEQFNYVTNNIKMWITEKLGWYYLILTTIIVFFCIFLIFSPIGKLKLGKPNDKPEFNTISWFAMLFSAGMGIGLVFMVQLNRWRTLLRHLRQIPKLLKLILKPYVQHFSIGDSMLGLFMVLLR